MPRYSSTSRLGVTATASITEKELGWIFREQLIADVGIDAQIERVDSGTPTGKLIAVQIKTGASHFDDRGSHLVYRGNPDHLDYWTGHSLPVLLVAHLPKTEETFWAHVDAARVKRSIKGWTIEIPKTNRFDAASKRQLAQIFEGSDSQIRLRHLTLDLPLMQHIRDGGTVAIECEEWINKSLGRSPIKVFVYDRQGRGKLQREWFTYYFGGVGSLLKSLFPWADASVDEEYYDMHYDRDYREDWEKHDERGRPIPDPNRVGPIYPYSEGGGEVEYYRVVLELSDLGKAFLEVGDYLNA
jgi:hypothetical protein